MAKNSYMNKMFTAIKNTLMRTKKKAEDFVLREKELADKRIKDEEKKDA